MRYAQKYFLTDNSEMWNTQFIKYNSFFKICTHEERRYRRRVFMHASSLSTHTHIYIYRGVCVIGCILKLSVRGVTHSIAQRKQCHSIRATNIEHHTTHSDIAKTIRSKQVCVSVAHFMAMWSHTDSAHTHNNLPFTSHMKNRWIGFEALPMLRLV